MSNQTFRVATTPFPPLMFYSSTAATLRRFLHFNSSAESDYMCLKDKVLPDGRISLVSPLELLHLHLPWLSGMYH